MRTNVEAALKTWSNRNQVVLVQEGGAFKLSWDDNSRYIDVFPDPKREIVIVQHGTIGHTDGETPRGMTRWREHELDENLTELKQVVDDMPLTVEPIAQVRKYTPSIDIGTVKGFKFR